MKNCLKCHFISLFPLENKLDIDSFPDAYRTIEGFDDLLQHICGNRVFSVKCFRDLWDAEKHKYNKIANIKNDVFRNDRDKKCPQFFPYDKSATPQAIVEKKKAQEEVIDRKFTRRLAWIAIAVSAFATLLAAIIPFLLRHFCNNPIL